LEDGRQSDRRLTDTKQYGIWDRLAGSGPSGFGRHRYDDDCERYGDATCNEKKKAAHNSNLNRPQQPKDEEAAKFSIKNYQWTIMKEKHCEYTVNCSACERGEWTGRKWLLFCKSEYPRLHVNSPNVIPRNFIHVNKPGLLFFCIHVLQLFFLFSSGKVSHAGPIIRHWLTLGLLQSLKLHNPQTENDNVIYAAWRQWQHRSNISCLPRPTTIISSIGEHIWSADKFVATVEQHWQVLSSTRRWSLASQRVERTWRNTPFDVNLLRLIVILPSL
jgi:hypothetical protein